MPGESEGLSSGGRVVGGDPLLGVGDPVPAGLIGTGTPDFWLEFARTPLIIAPGWRKTYTRPWVRSMDRSFTCDVRGRG